MQRLLPTFSLSLGGACGGIRRTPARQGNNGQRSIANAVCARSNMDSMTPLEGKSGRRQMDRCRRTGAPMPVEQQHPLLVAALGLLVLGGATPVAAGPSAAGTDFAAVETTPAPSDAESRAKALMEAARESVLANDYTRAIALYTRVLELGDHSFRQQAQELLGLARERNGQLAHARAEYETYLKLYPKGEGAERVRQRLAGLVTARDAPKTALRSAKRTADASPWQVFGSVSQSYQRYESAVDGEENRVDQSAAFTTLDVHARRRSKTYDIRTRVSADYRHDLLDGEHDRERISTMHVDAISTTGGLSSRLGRQSRTTAGVLGRFDGLALSLPITGVSKVNVVAGYPVDYYHGTSISTERYFYGMSLDLGTFANAWDVSTFAIQQQVGELVDRQAVGGELRYFSENRSLFALVDYDTHFQELNLATLFGNYALASGTRLNFFADYRKSPILTSDSALIGQTFGSLEEMALSYNENEITQLAKDRTATNQSVSLGASQPVSSKATLSGDVTVSNLSATTASGGVPEFPASGDDYFFSVQWMMNDWLTPSDSHVLSARYSDTQGSNTWSLTVNSRFGAGRWQVNPRLRYDLRKDEVDDAAQSSVAPALRVLYRLDDFTIDGEIGRDWTTRDIYTGTQRVSSEFVYLGLRKDF